MGKFEKTIKKEKSVKLERIASLPLNILQEAPLDPQVVLGDLGGAGVSDFMTALRKTSRYTPKKARSAAQALVDKMKRDRASRNPAQQRSRSVSLPKRITVKPEPTWDDTAPSSVIKPGPTQSDADASKAHLSLQFFRTPLRTQISTNWSGPPTRSVSTRRNNLTSRTTQTVSIKQENASREESVRFGPAKAPKPVSAPAGQPYPYTLPALERESNAEKPQTWSDLMAKNKTLMGNED